MPVLYVTSDRPAVGKTALISALAAEFSSSNANLAYFKPFSYTPEDDPDVAFVHRDVLPDSNQADQTTPMPMPDAIEAGWSASEEAAEAAERLRESVRTLTEEATHVLVEGPSLLTPDGEPSLVSITVADLLDAAVVLLVHFRPGLDAEEIAGMCEPFGGRLSGVVVNSVSHFRQRKLRQEMGKSLESRGIRFLGAIPEDRLMLSPTVDQIALHLGGQWVLGQEKSQALVEQFLIGGNIMDAGETYFGRQEKKAVIVRGDRPDIQMAALVAPTTCLVLTGGHQPIQYVHHQAEVEEVPLLVVETDTMATLQAIETVLTRVSTYHTEKVARFGELLQSNTDLGAIRSAF